MILVNTETIPGYRITAQYGIATGSAVRARFFGSDFLAAIKNFFGGEIRGYTKLLMHTRERATERMMQQAESVGANAIVNVRYSTSTIARGAAEIFAYGTAVTIEPEQQQRPIPSPAPAASPTPTPAPTQPPQQYGIDRERYAPHPTKPGEPST